MIKSGFAAHRLQEAVFSVLEGDVQLGARLNGIFDQAPADISAPYITFGDTSIAPYDTASERGSRITFELNIWSDDASQMEAKELMAIVVELLHHQPIEVNDFNLHQIFYQSSSVTRQTDDTGNFYRGRISFRALLFAL